MAEEQDNLTLADETDSLLCMYAEHGDARPTYRFRCNQRTGEMSGVVIVALSLKGVQSAMDDLCRVQAKITTTGEVPL